MPVIESYAPGTFCWAELGTLVEPYLPDEPQQHN